jgi:hypothetical protein
MRKGDEEGDVRAMRKGDERGDEHSPVQSSSVVV